MEKAKISTIQLFSMMFMFEMGTALVISYGLTAEKDAWLAILLSMLLSIVINFIYYLLFMQYPNLPLTSYVRKIFGKHLGWMISFIYIIYFLYICSRNIRELTELLVTSTLNETPLLGIIIPFVLVICYVLYLGIEVFARTAEVFIVILFLFGIVGNLLVLISGNIDFNNLLPFLENGWKPVLKTIFPYSIAFPFSELFAFSMILPYINKRKKVKKVWLTSLLFSGLLLSWTISLNIAVLGVDATRRATFPTLATVGKINLLDFIQRMDAIVVFTLLITVFFKASIYFYVSIIGIADIFRLENYRPIILPVGFIVTYLSLVVSSNIQEHYYEGINGYYYYHIPLLLIIPLMMLIVTLIKSRWKKKTS